MTSRLSVLQSCTSRDVVFEPFPHIVIKNALPLDLVEELVSEYPDLGILGVDKSIDNKRWSTPARAVSANSQISNLWKEMIEYHSSEAFFLELVSIFGDAILSKLDGIWSSRSELEHLRVGIRQQTPSDRADVFLDAQIAGNTPALTPGVPRGIHFDSRNALYAGLFYLRDPDDNSIGGDLQIWKWKSGYSNRKKASEYREGVDVNHCELIGTIPYAANTLVLLINSIDSLHSVTTRQPTPHTRKFMNLLADFNHDLFEFKPFLHRRIIPALKRRLRS